jgi:O-antigen/teichoic acid export membrane protein
MVIMISYSSRLIARLQSSHLARNSVWMFLGYGLRIIVQAGYFVLIARSLGPEQYGSFVGVVALISIVAPFSSLGAGNLLIKNVARNSAVFSEYWGNALLMSAVSGVLLLGLVLSCARLMLPATIPWPLIVLVSVSDLIVVKGAEIAAQAFQAVDNLRYTAKLNLLPSILRLISAAILFWVWHRTTALRWSWFYVVSTALSSAFAIYLTGKMLGQPKLALRRIPGEIREGFYFGVSLSAQTVYNDIDKTMLARLSTLDAAGIYAAAYRLIEVAFTPVRAVLNAAYPTFFRLGQNGIAASFDYAKRILPRMIAYSVLAFVVLFVAAPIVPVFLGHEYARTVEALRWLAVLPFLKSIHYFFADAMTGAGYQNVRTFAQILVAGVNVVLNLLLMPAYSWRGAAWASIASDGLLVVSLYIAMRAIHRRTAPIDTDRGENVYAAAE